MITQAQVPEVLDKIRKKISVQGAERNLDLRIDDQDYRVEDDLLFVCVYPANKGIRPYDFAEVLTKVEHELRDEGIENVLVVPIPEG